MQFRVSGVNHATGARMVLELEAPSKAAAEHKARAAGMDVQHVEPIGADPVARHGSQHRGEDPGRAAGVHPVVKTLVLLALLAVVVYFAWPWIRRTLGG
ncbi:MAG: hypothetical protein NZ561_02095 [Phycisphaerae bacterium]|nr:hypothetical protein [Phycisphaerae bacterium]MDW8261139.1 hypothetical protein [Phycisphaerales bacterium]